MNVQFSHPLRKKTASVEWSTDDDEASSFQKKKPQHREHVSSSHSSPALAVLARKGKQNPPQGKNPVDSDDHNNHTDLLVAVAKPFIIQAFRQQHQQKQHTTDAMWDTLATTPWQNDYEIALAALQGNLNPQKLLLASESEFLTNVEFVTHAFFVVSGGNTLQEEPNDEETTSSSSQNLWNVLDENMHRNPTIAFAALKGGLDFDELPDTIRGDKPGILKALKEGGIQWEHLPDRYKKDVDYALNMSPLSYSTCDFSNVLDHIEDKERLWKEWVCQNPQVTRPFDWRKAPLCVTSDPTLMLDVIRKVHYAAMYLDPSLFDNRDFLDSLLTANIKALACFPADIYQRFPDIVTIESVGKYAAAGGGGGDLESLRKVVPRHHWSDRPFVLNWVSCGGSMDPQIPEILRSDEEIVLTFAKVSNDPSMHRRRRGSSSRRSLVHLSWRSEAVYRYISRTLRGNKHFLLQLCEVVPDPRDFMYLIDSSLESDMELQVTACSRNPKYRPRNAATRRDVNTYMEAQLLSFEGFFKGILCGARATASTGSPLQLLDQGLDVGIKKTIASYVGFPRGKHLENLFQAAVYHNIHVFHPYTLQSEN